MVGLVAFLAALSSRANRFRLTSEDSVKGLCAFIIDYVTAGQTFALETRFATIVVANGRVDQDCLAETLECRLFATDGILHSSDLLTRLINKFTDRKNAGKYNRNICFNAFHAYLSLLNKLGYVLAVSGALDIRSRSFVQLGLLSGVKRKRAVSAGMRSFCAHWVHESRMSVAAVASARRSHLVTQPADTCGHADHIYIT